MPKALVLLFFLLIGLQNPISAGGLLWVGAHPDDEYAVAPLMGELCQKNQCHMIVFTKGDKGKCKLGSACPSDLGNLRALEMQQSADYFGASLHQFDLGDSSAGSSSQVVANWISRLGGQFLAEARLSNLIRTIKPDAVITFDPRHGIYCHADHMATGVLTLGILQKIGFPKSKTFMVESKIAHGTREDGSPYAGFDKIVEDQNIIDIDANNFWFHGLEVLSIHRSQFLPQEIAIIENAPMQFRKVHLIPLDKAETSKSQYENLCPNI